MASPTLTRGRGEPFADGTRTPVGQTGSGGSGRSPRNARMRAQVRAQWLILAAALTVLAGVMVAWGIDRAADRVDVVSIARAVPAGTVIEAGDLTTTAIAFDTPVVGLVPASSLQALVGRVATVDLAPGVLLSAGMWADGTQLSAGERTVGALVDVGKYPSGLARGASALVVSTSGAMAGPSNGSSDGSSSGGSSDVLVRVLDADIDERGALRVTLAVADADASMVARLAAMDSLVLVGVPVVDTASADGAP